MTRSGYRSIVKNASHLGLAQLFTNVIRIIYAIALARSLGAEIYGKYNYGLSWYLFFLPISTFGLNWILSREIGRNPKALANLISNTFIIRITATLLVFTLSVILAFIWETDAEVIIFLVTLSTALIGRSLSLWFDSLFIAIEKAIYVLLLTSSFRFIEVASGLILLYLHQGILSLALLHTGVWTVQACSSFYLLNKKVESPFFLSFNRKEILRIIRVSIPFLTAMMLLSWLLQGPMLLFRLLNGFGDNLGFLGLSLQAFIIIATLTAQIGNAALPILSRSLERKDGKSDDYIHQVLRLGWILTGLLVIGSLTLAPTIIDALVGSQYSPVNKLLPFALSIVMFYFWIVSFQGIIGIHGHYGWVVSSNILGAAIFTLAVFIFTPTLGNLGVIISMGLGLSSIALSFFILLNRHHKIQWRKYFFSPAISSLIGIITSWLLLDFGNLFSAILGTLSFILSIAATKSLSLRELKHLSF